MAELQTQIPRFVFFLFLKKELLLHTTQIQAKGQNFGGILIMQEQSVFKSGLILRVGLDLDWLDGWMDLEELLEEE